MTSSSSWVWCNYIGPHVLLHQYPIIGKFTHWDNIGWAPPESSQQNQEQDLADGGRFSLVMKLSSPTRICTTSASINLASRSILTIGGLNLVTLLDSSHVSTIGFSLFSGWRNKEGVRDYQLDNVGSIMFILAGGSTACFLSLFSKARLRVMPNGVKVLSVFGFPSDKIFTSLFLLVPPRAIFFPFGSASLTCDPWVPSHCR